MQAKAHSVTERTVRDVIMMTMAIVGILSQKDYDDENDDDHGYDSYEHEY